MRISKRAAFGVAATAAVAFAVPSIATPGHPAGGNGEIACGDGTVAWDPTSVWPPNHKMQTVNVAYTSGQDDAQYDTSSITVDMITHDQYLTDGTEMNGSGHTLIDFEGVGNSGTADEGEPAATTAGVVGERSGRDQTGRTYTITVTCSDYTDGMPPVEGVTSESDTVNLTVTVPHDQGHRS
jgi:hypothetical protein